MGAVVERWDTAADRRRAAREAARRRRETAEAIPWVRRLRRPRECGGFMSHTPLKAVFGTLEQRAARPRCRNRAWWHFTALRRSWARSGDYCWSHLVSRGLYGDALEEARTERWLERHRAGE